MREWLCDWFPAIAVVLMFIGYLLLCRLAPGKGLGCSGGE